MNKRIQLDVTIEKAEEIKHLMEKTCIPTYKELINAAFALFEWAVEEVEEGRVIASIRRDDSGSIQDCREIVSSAFRAVRKNRNKK